MWYSDPWENTQACFWYATTACWECREQVTKIISGRWTLSFTKEQWWYNARWAQLRPSNWVHLWWWECPSLVLVGQWFLPWVCKVVGLWQSGWPSTVCHQQRAISLSNQWIYQAGWTYTHVLCRKLQPSHGYTSYTPAPKPCHLFGKLGVNCQLTSTCESRKTDQVCTSK